jgi:hypothetical protein
MKTLVQEFGRRLLLWAAGLTVLLAIIASPAFGQVQVRSRAPVDVSRISSSRPDFAHQVNVARGMWFRQAANPVAFSKEPSSLRSLVPPGFTFDPFNSSPGYVSTSNPMGTGDSAYFPNGISTAGYANWIYGTITFIGNAPSNGRGHQFNSSPGSNDAYLAIGGGAVGIGTTIPTSNLEVSGPGYTFSGSSKAQVVVTDSASMTADAGGGLVFRGLYTSGGAGAEYAAIKSGKDNSTSGQYGAYLSLWTRTNGASPAERMRIDSSGNVGIGTTTPYTKLSLTSSDSVSGISLFTDPYEASRIWGTRIYKQDSFGGHANGIPLVIDTQYGSTWYTSATFGAGVDPYHPSFRSYGQTYLASDNGNVGISTTSPSSKLQVVGGDIGIDGNQSLWLSASKDTGIGENPSTGVINFLVPANGSTRGFNFQSGGTSRFFIDGTTGNVTASGSITARYQDVAEWVPSSGQLPAGTVVVLDSTKSNQVTSSSVSYDTRVAGVVSEQPGIALGEKSEGKVLVATTGRVRVRVDATRGPIHIGDLLVTSDVSGMAMKSEPIMIGGRQIHAPGTLIGKALEPLEEGKGEILVLLSLQ